MLDQADRVLEKAEDFGGKTEEYAKDHRVPVPQANLPFLGPVRSLVLKQVCLQLFRNFDFNQGSY